MVKAHCTNSTSKIYKNDEWVSVELEVLGSGYVRQMVEGQLVLVYEKPMIGGGVTNGYNPEFKGLGLLNLTGCMDQKAKNFKTYHVNRDDSKCLYR